ncbi:unnamed protein product [Lactuca saligna]|uniref:cytochrome-c oxidase n=1 Tax=Lactuca saligna TaxID=75948 RepID=A0AA35YHW5_LACSI|nr:unnamed protein product [Lactuca saligna]
MAIRISRCSNTYDARNNRLTSRYLFLPHSYFGFRLTDLGSRFMAFPKRKNPIPQRIVHGTTIEILRTIFPSIIPMFIAIPSFALLYSMDEVVVNPAITIKAIGHQWYRSAPLHEGDLSATKYLKNMVREASGLPVISHSRRRET